MAHLAHELVAVAIRHTDVADQDIRVDVREDVDGFLRALRGQDMSSFVAQDDAQRADRVGIVVLHQERQALQRVVDSLLPDLSRVSGIGTLLGRETPVHG